MPVDSLMAAVYPSKNIFGKSGKSEKKSVENLYPPGSMGTTPLSKVV
jgi:hypothetical protein